MGDGHCISQIFMDITALEVAQSGICVCRFFFAELHFLKLGMSTDLYKLQDTATSTSSRS